MNAKIVPRAIRLSVASRGVVVEYDVFLERDGSTSSIAEGLGTFDTAEITAASTTLFECVQRVLNELAEETSSNPAEDSPEDMEL